MQYTEEAIKNRKNRSKKIRKFFKTLVYILLIPMLVYNSFLIVQAVINPKETPKFLGVKMYVIVSGSMSPELEIGDVVIVEDIDNEILKEKDVISFRQGQSIITHRVIEVIEENGKVKYKTKGDHNNTEDLMLVSQEDIEGRVMKKITGIGKAVLFLRDKTLIISIVIFYYIYLVHDQNLQNRKALRKIKREKYEKRKRQELNEGEE